MRGNWSTTDHVAAPATGQQIHVEHRDLPHAPATPAWNIADRIVKEEPIEDKNNDSGVSPGHYTSNSVSPRSRRSSTTANGSLSPGSATSQDSGAMQYDYTPQRIFKSCVSPIAFSHTNGVHTPKLSASYGTDITQGNRNVQTDQPIDMVSSTMKPDNDDSEAMLCPICPFSTVHRAQFNEHLAAHCSPKCDTTEFLNSTYMQQSLSEDGARGSPSQGDRSEHEFDDVDEPGLRVPRVNCQGKVKTFRCKQCNFVAITKLEFWEHSRGHIKAEKLLTCPKCPFVTEYKHHLEYHLRNHFGSKPFKCDKCPYSCVNKSMLNSHLKSHSNVYQYRCAECSYATKYCHSLKLHLRKYAHKPAMVLNPDGSPNPLPIIDIYGTRRGPKQKSVPKTDDTASLTIGSTGVSPGKIHAIPSPGGILNNSLLTDHHPVQTQMNMLFPYGHMINAFSLPTHLFQNYSDNNNDDRKPDAFKTSPQLYDALNRDKVDDYSHLKIVSPAIPKTPESMGTIRYTEPLDITENVPMTPLDLSKSEVTQSSKTNSPRTGGTSRRKGRAFKLDKLVVAQDSEDESYAAAAATMQHMKTAIQLTNGNDDRTVGGASDFNCQYCDIAFGNIVMYTVHMGYHGYKNPFTCNMCGQECPDKVSFFLHLVRSSHS